MADYNGIEALMASTDNMVHLVNNTGHDDDTMTFPGVDWFKFNSVTATNIFVSGNSWFGFGTNTAQLNICNRDTKLWNFWREEGTLFNYYRFLRMKWDGYAQYNSTSPDLYFCYEVYLIDTGDIFINVIKAPNNSSYLGSSQLICGSQTTPLSLTTGEGKQLTFTHQNETGSGFTLTYETIVINAPFDRKYLITDKTNKIYTIEDMEEEKILVVIPNITVLTTEVFLTYGVDSLPEAELLKSLTNPALLYWQDSENELPEYRFKLTALPFNQTIYTENISMTDATIVGIEKVAVDCDEATLFAVSFDEGATWYTYVNHIWSTLSESQSGMKAAALSEIGTDAWAEKAVTGHFMFRFVLTEASFVNSITTYFLN